RAALAHVREYLRAQRDAAIVSGLLFRTDEPGFRLEAPVTRPGKVLAVGVNYKDHAEEAKIPLPERPIIFTKLPSCVIATGAPIHRPRVSTKLDFEGELCVNRVLKQDASTGAMIFGVGALVEYVSQAFTLEPGDVIFTGTPAGVGSTRSPREWLKAGDVVRVEISGLGVLENRVVDEP